MQNIDGIDIPDEFDYIDFSDNQFKNTFIRCVRGTDNLFINGVAGTGKSELIKLMSQLCKNIIVLSTTGITAMALSSDNVPAKTVHSFFSFKPFPIIRNEDLDDLFFKHKQVLQTAETIVIDEVSMMSNNLFDKICEKIIRHRDDNEIPRLVFFGDVMQLPPVIENNKTVIDYYQNEYNGNIMFFNSNYYSQLNFKTIVLRKSFRQTDPDFAEKLFQVGFRDHTQETLDYFNQRVMSLPKFEQYTGDKFMYLTPTNSVVNKMNFEYIKSLTGKEKIFKTKYSQNFPKNKMPDNDTITIKEGAQVMCTANQHGKIPLQTCSNGMIGIVIKVDGPSGGVMINLKDGTTKEILRGLTYLWDIKVKGKRIDYVPEHWYKQISCSVAKAATIHRLQGKTLDTGYISLMNWVPQGITYVALSRFKTLDSLALSRPLRDSDLVVNKESYNFLTM